MNRVVLGWLAVLFVVGGGGLIFVALKDQDRSGSTGPVTTNNVSIDGFILTERSGEPFYSKDLKGKVWIASFFFASCPTTCMEQNRTVQRLHKEFGDRGVRFLSITVDPKNDTPETLRKYARTFKAPPNEWFFLTGDLTYIRRLGVETFELIVAEQTHSDSLVLVDKWGNIRNVVNWKEAAEMDRLRQQVNELLAETEEPDLGQDDDEDAETDTGEQSDTDDQDVDEQNTDEQNTDEQNTDEQNTDEKTDEKTNDETDTDETQGMDGRF